MTFKGTTISLQEAQERAVRWREQSIEGANFKASLISSEDLNGLVGELGENGIRAYNGINADGDYKLMIVAVDAEGNDLIDEENGHYIYDFTQPCPKNCDLNSPLYTLS